MAKQSTGRHRANVEVNVFESMELRSRRSIREAERKKQSRAAKRELRRARKVAEVIVSESQELIPTGRYIVAGTRQVKWYRRRSVRNGFTMAVAAGIFSTVALPAYAFSPEVSALAGFSTINAASLSRMAGTQSTTVAGLLVSSFNRDSYASASANTINGLLNQQSSYKGPTAPEYVLNPPYSTLDGSTILKVASKYVGTPYVFGGETPNGFDCSGYVRFVFSQFGLDLPHSVIAQSHMGIVVKQADALPGDLVILDDLSHDGIYAGNGLFYHAPRVGDTVKLAPIFTPNVFYVRLATK